MQIIYLTYSTQSKANANKYSWVWKKRCIKSRDKTFLKVSKLLEEINDTVKYCGVAFETRTEYEIPYMEQIISQYLELTGVNPEMIPSGRGHRKTPEQRNYNKLREYCDQLKR